MDKTEIDKMNHYGYLEGWLSTILNIVLFGLKYWAGIVSGSVAIIADAWHTLSDSLTSLIVLAGTKISTQPADREHPFGHGRAELIGAVIIAVLLSMVAVGFVKESIEKLHSHTPARYGRVAIVVTIISIIAKEVMAQLALHWGRLTGMKSLTADGWHHRSDAISSVVILAGIFAGSYLWWIDGVLGLIVSAILFYAAYEILKDSVSSLLGEKAGEDLQKTLKDIARRVYPEEIHIHHVHLHRYGRHCEVTFHIRLPDGLTLNQAHEVSSLLENTIRKELLMETTIHVEPLSAHPGDAAI